MTVEPLTYDVSPRRRRWSAKWLVIAGLITATLAGWRWWPVVLQHANAIVCGIRVTHVVLPEDQLAITATGKIILPVPAAWQRFYENYAGASPRDSSLLFLQWRTAPNGSRRLVKVGFVPGLGAPLVGLDWASHDLHGWRYEPRDFCESTLVASTANGFPAYSEDFFTGVADAHDESHFAIRYRFNQRDGFVDGYLMNDGIVKLEPRPFPFNGRPARTPAGRVPLRGDRY